MHIISPELKSLFNSSVSLLNQPTVKEGIKNIAGSVTFVFGLVEIYDCYQMACRQEIEAENTNVPKWVLLANKVTIICAKISLILSAGISRPGIYLFSSIGLLLPTIQLDRVFGPNTIFMANPWHPRHIVSIAAVVFALPSVIQVGVCDKTQLMTCFNAFTSRPLLHLVNQLVKG